MQEAAGVVPAFLAVVGSAGAVPADSADDQAAGVPVGDRPADEVGGLVPVGGVLARGPAVQVTLRAGGEGEVAGGQPVQEVAGGGDVTADVEGLQVGSVGFAEPLTEFAQVTTDRRRDWPRQRCG